MSDNKGQRWIGILEHLERNGRSRFDRNQGSGGEVAEDSDLVQSSDLSKEEVESAIIYLSDADLIEPRNDHYRVTPAAFEVIQDRNRSRQNQSLNSALVSFTFFLVLVSVVGQIPGETGRLIGSLAVILGVLATVAYNQYSDQPSW